MAGEQLRGVFKYSLVRYVALGLGFVKSFVNAWVLGPTEFGLLGLCLLALGFLAFSHLGILYSMNREYPLRELQGDTAGCKRILSTSLAFVAAVSSLLLLGSAIAVIVCPRSTSVYISLVLVVAVFDLFRSYFTNYFRLMHNFNALNRLELINHGVSIVVLLVVIGSLGVAGALLAQVAGGFACLCFCIINARGMRLGVHAGILTELFYTGLPLLVYNLGYFLMNSIDRAFIVTFYGKSELGYYTFATQVAAGTLVFLSSVLFLYYPNAIQKMHRETAGDRAALDFSLRVTRYFESVAVALYVVGAIAIDLLTLLFLPDYQASVTVLRIFLLGAIASQCAYIWNVTIVSNHKQWMLVGIQVGVMCLAVLLNFLFAALSFGLIGVALASLLSMMAYVWWQQWVAIRSVLRLGRDSSLLAFRGSTRFAGFAIFACFGAGAGLVWWVYAFYVLALACGFYLGVWRRGWSELRAGASG